jgi:hypothetical protein
MARKLQDMLVVFIVVTIAGAVLLTLMSIEHKRDDIILKDHTVEFCSRWVKDVECGEWADAMIDQHREGLHLCFQNNAPKSMGAYECVLNEVVG